MSDLVERNRQSRSSKYMGQVQGPWRVYKLGSIGKVWAECKCGQVWEIRTDKIASGRPCQTCAWREGARKRSGPRWPFSPGDRFGRLVVADIPPVRKGRGWAYQARCDCGEIWVGEASNLTSGNTKSCGCAKRERTREMGKAGRVKIEVGTRFERLVVTKELEVGGYLCQCDCGEQRAFRGSDLVKGLRQSCGCLMREKGLQNLLDNQMARTKVNKNWETGFCDHPECTGNHQYKGKYAESLGLPEMCPASSQLISARMKKVIEVRKFENKCIRCGAEVTPGDVHCADCMSKNRERGLKRYYKIKQEGKCVDCKESLDGSSTVRCISHTILRQIKNYEKRAFIGEEIPLTSLDRPTTIIREVTEDEVREFKEKHELQEEE